MKSSSGQARTNIRNQIYYVTLNQRGGNSNKSVKTYPRVDIYSDHVLKYYR